MAKIESAFKNYENEVTPSGDSFSGLKGKISGMISSVTNDGMIELNKLTTMGSKFSIGGLLGKLSGLSSKYLAGMVSMLSDMSNDALNTLSNSATVFSMNIAENFINDVKKTIYIPERAFLIQVKALYYAGGDLAYKNRYIRTAALSRDWIETLQFCDKEYDIIYNREYRSLDSDLTIAARNSCWKNVSYILENIEKAYDKTKLSYDNVLFYPESQKNKKILSSLKSELEYYEELYPKYLHMLISYSYTYMTSANLKRIMDKFSKFVKPKYFGSTDDKYNKKYMFRSSDIKRMLPPFIQHEGTPNTNMYLMADTKEQVSDVNGVISNIPNPEPEFNGNVSTLKPGTNNNAVIATNKINLLRKNVLVKNNSRKTSLTQDALTRGSAGVYNSLSSKKESMQNLWDPVYFKNRKTAAQAIKDLNGDDEYVILRNKNIKTIYVLLSSVTIYNADVMVNEEFYNRCKLKTMNVLASSYDKVKGLIGASSIVGSIFDMSDVISSSIHKYQLQVEKNLFDPSKNVTMEDDGFKSMLLSDFSLNNDDYMLPNGETIENSLEDSLNESISETSIVESGQISSGNSQSSQTSSNKQVETEIGVTVNSNFTAKKEISSITRYLNKLPMVTKRDIIVKYLTFFYNTCLSQKLSETDVKKTFALLIYNVFGRTKIESPYMMTNLFNNASNVSLSRNITTMISMDKLNLLSKYLRLYELDTFSGKTIEHLAQITIKIMSYEIESTSFMKTVYLYDVENLRSIVKQIYLSKIEYLKKIVLRGNARFFREKDATTKTFGGFNRGGIFGYERRDNRIKYTPIETGDWNSIVHCEEGTFFGGNPLTENNGIKYLNPNKDTIMSTSIRTGDWHIEKHYDVAFFINKIDDSLHMWDSEINNVYKVPIINISEWEIVELENYSRVIFISKTGKGIKLWDTDTKLVSDTMCITGSNYKFKYIKAGYIFYTTDSSNFVYIFNNITFSRIYTTEIMISDIIDWTEKIITTITSPPVPVEGQPEGPPIETQITINRQHLTIGTLSGHGLIDIYADNNIVTFIKSTTIHSNILTMNNVYLSRSKNKIYYVAQLNENPIYNQFGELELKTTRLLTSVSPTPPPVGSIIALPSYIDSLVIKNPINGEIDMIGYTQNYMLFKQQISTTVSNHKFVQFDKNDYELVTYTLGAPKSFYQKNCYDVPYVFIELENDIYTFNNNHFVSIFDNVDHKTSDWSSYNFKKNLIFVNDKSFGINIFDPTTKKVIKSSLTTGNWILTETKTHYFALSTNGTNQGIRLSGKNFNFYHLPTVSVPRGDFGIPGYDPDKDKLYFGDLRTNTLLDVPYLASLYDIDEFVYYQNPYQLLKISKIGRASCRERV